MSNSIEIKDENLIPIKEAASLVPYSKDYIARLAREGKIVASQVGRNWYIDIKSLQKFSELATLQEEVRMGQLRSERKSELVAKEKLNSLEVTINTLTRRHKFEATVMSMSTLYLGILFGFVFYNFSFVSVPGAFFTAVVSDSMTGTLYSVNEDNVFTYTEIADPVIEPRSMLLASNATEYPVFLTESETRVLSATSTAILIFHKNKDIQTENDIKDLFSDRVEVSFTDNNSGVVSYQSEEGVEKDLPFLRVPVETQESQDGTVDNRPNVIDDVQIDRQ